MAETGLPEFVLDIFGQKAAETGAEAAGTALNFVGDPKILIIGIVLIAATVLVILFIKKIIVNSVLGAVFWAIAYFVFNIKLPMLPSLAVSIIFGPAGVGVMLLLRFLGII